MPRLTTAHLAAIIVMLGVVAIVSSSYANLNGDHIWRQSDVYSQILGMLGQKGTSAASGSLTHRP